MGERNRFAQLVAYKRKVLQSKSSAHTCVPVHDFVRELTILFLGLQLLAFFPSQRVLCPRLGTAESPLQALDRTLTPTDNALVVCLEKDTHAVYDGVGAFKVLRIRRGVQDIALLP